MNRSRLACALVALLLCACVTTDSDLNSGIWHYRAGLYGEAIPRLLRSVPALERSNPADPRLPDAYVALGDMAAADKRLDLAEQFYGKAVAAATSHHADVTWLNRNAAVHAGNFFLNQNRFTEALPLLQRAARLSENDAGTPRVLHAIDLDNLSVAQAGLKDYAQADVSSTGALRLLDTLEPSPQHLATRGVVLYNRAMLLADQGQVAEADAAFKQALALVTQNGEAWRRKVIVVEYGAFLRKQGREADAKALEGS